MNKQKKATIHPNNRSGGKRNGNKSFAAQTGPLTGIRRYLILVLNTFCVVLEKKIGTMKLYFGPDKYIGSTSNR